MMSHMLITYSKDCADTGHVDPNFTHLVYGDSNNRGTILLNNLQRSSYVFFNTTIDCKRYITAYFYVEKILVKGIDDVEINNLNELGCAAASDEVIIVGNRNKSKVLTLPLLLDKDLLLKLNSFNVNENYFSSKKSELQAISYKTYNPTKLTEEEKDKLESLCKNRG